MTAQIPATVAGLPDSMGPNVEPPTHSCSSRCKVTKIQIIQQHGQATQQLCHETKEKDIALLDVKPLTKKLTKSKELVGKLCVCLKDARTEVRSNNKCHSLELSTINKSISEFANNITAKSESIEKEHKLTLISVTKNVELKLQGNDHRHSLEVSKMTQFMIAKMICMCWS
jgi:hypothetical protein